MFRGPIARPLFCLLLLSAAGCAAPEPPAGAESPAEIGLIESLRAHRIVDLTHELSVDSLYWPNGSPFEFEQEVWGFDDAGDWYAMARFATPEHLGTHLDAPIHFAPEVWTNAQIPLEHFIGPAVVIDISARAAGDADAVLEPDDITAWRERNGELPEGAIVLVRTGWSERWPDWNGYYGSDDPFDASSLHFPGVGPDAAHELVAAGVVGVGIDTASIDPGNDTSFRTHRVLAEAQLYNLENLTGLAALPEAGAVVIALPTKIADSSGGPARVLALVPR